MVNLLSVLGVVVKTSSRSRDGSDAGVQPATGLLRAIDAARGEEVPPDAGIANG
jgi:hypothetical protein